MSIYIPFNQRTVIGESTSASAGAEANRAGLAELQNRLERQNLLLQTLLRLLLKKGIIQEDEFKQWLAYVDQLDGKADGKLQEEKGTKACPACGRNSTLHAAKCQYCDAVFPPEFLSHESAAGPA